MRTVLILGSVVLGLLLSVGTASAGMLAVDPNAYNDGEGLVTGDGNPFWRGTVPYSRTISVFTLTALVDYAVYAPGDFNDSFPGMDPSAGAHYVYAYQLFNLAPSQSINAFTIGFDGHPGEAPANIGFIAGPDTDPQTPQFIPPVGNPKFSASWNFLAGVGLGPSMTSDILIFTSPAGPEPDDGSIQALVPKSDLLPSPVPEPTTLTLLGLGSVVFVVARRRFSRRHA